MTRRRILLFILVAAVLAALIVFQVHQWRKFDWEVFSEQTAEVNWWLVAAAVGMIYAADALRGIRWAIFLRPVKHVPAASLVAPQFVGFTALALLGRPGELIRPYLIARRTNLSMASQMAVWTVERIFDISAVACLLGFTLFLSPTVRGLPNYTVLRNAGLLVIILICLGIAAALVVRKYGSQISSWIERRYSRRFPAQAGRVCRRISAFSEGLNTIHNFGSFVALALLSLVIWSMVAASYRLVTNAYHEPLSDFGFAEVILLMFASIAGGVLQLPAVGGGSQIATIATLISVFEIDPELATSCGILLWLVTFMSVLPLGLALAHKEHVSLRELLKAEEKAEIQATAN